MIIDYALLTNIQCLRCLKYMACMIKQIRSTLVIKLKFDGTFSLLKTVVSLPKLKIVQGFGSIFRPCVLLIFVHQIISLSSIAVVRYVYKRGSLMTEVSEDHRFQSSFRSFCNSPHILIRSKIAFELQYSNLLMN